MPADFKHGLRTKSNPENIASPNLDSKIIHKNSKYKSQVKTVSINSSNLYCYFCEYTRHSSHVCKKFNTKEEFWSKIHVVKIV